MKTLLHSLFFGALFFGGYSANAQMLVGLNDSGISSMDLNTCTYKTLNTQVNYNGAYMGFSTFDQAYHRYIWESHPDSTGQDEIGVADAVTGKILNIYVIPNHTLGEIEYDATSQMLYGIGDNTFASMDLATGKISTIATFSSNITCFGGITCFDPVTETYFYEDNYTVDTCLLYMINAKTGSRSSVKIPNMTMIEYSVSTGKMYGVQHFAFVSYDWKKNVFSILNSHIGYYFMQGMSTFDENSGQYIIYGADSNNNDYIYKVDVTTGAETTCSIPVDYFYNPEVYYWDGETGVSHDTAALSSPLAIYPNPASGNRINLSTEGFPAGTTLYISMYNSQGFCMQTRSIAATGDADLSLPVGEPLNPGLYLITVTDGHLKKSGRFVKDE